MNILEARRRTLGKGVYKKTVEGNPAIAQGSLARMYPGITMQGWTEQAQYEGNQLLPLPVGKVIESESGNNTLTVTESGVNLNFTDSTPGEYTNDIYVFGNTQYNIEAGYEDASAYIPQGLYILITDIVSSNVEVFISVWRNGVKLDLVPGTAPKPANFALLEGDKIRIGLRPKNTLYISNATLMVIKQTLPSTTPYEPYTGGQPSPNPDYPQEITSAGKYDEGTGKWEYEITIANAQTDPDKNQTVTLTADRPLTKWDRLTKKNGQWGWVYKSAEINITDESPLQKYGGDKISLYVSDAYLLGIPYCEKYVCQNGVPATENRIGLSSGSHAFVIYDTRYLDNVESYKQWLSENPLTLWYETTEETFVPLSESEQEAMNALHTFRPTTVLSNDCDCNMILTYKTKKSLEVTT